MFSNSYVSKSVRQIIAFFNLRLTQHPNFSGIRVVTCTLIPSCSASHWSSPNTDCEERGHLRSENSYFSANLILKGESGHNENICISVIQKSGGLRDHDSYYHSLNMFTYTVLSQLYLDFL